MRTAAVLLAVALSTLAEDPPLAPGVTVEVRADRTEFAIGDPILLDVIYKNEGKETWDVHEPHVHMFYDNFEVRDAAGARLPNPFGDIEYGGYDGPVTVHKLPPGGTATVRQYVNWCIAFDRPGTYFVMARGELLGPSEGPLREFRCPSQPLRIKILPAPDKKTRDAIVADLKALSRDPWGKLREHKEYARYRPYVTELNGATDALRLLAFRRDQDLLPFWIGLLGKDGGAYAEEALAGLPDRAAVLKALEERLAAGERKQLLWVYTCLAVPKTDDLEWKDVYARRKEIEDRYK